MAASAQICIRGIEEFRFHEEYKLWIYTRKSPSPDIFSICDETEYFVYPTRHKNVWYNDDFYFKLVSPHNLEPYIRLGGHPNFPQLIKFWNIDDGSIMIVMNHIIGLEVLDAGIGSTTLAQQYKYYAMVNQTLSAIDFAHSVGLFLFDSASYANVLVDTDRAMMYFIDLDNTLTDGKMQPDEYYDTIAVVWHLIELWTPNLNDYGRKILELEDDEDFFATDHPEIMTAFCQQGINKFSYDGPMYKAIQMLIEKLEPFLHTNISKNFTEGFSRHIMG